MHVLNPPRMFYMTYAMVKPFLSEAIVNSIMFHPDATSLHKHIDPKILPNELGGTLGPFDNAPVYEAMKKISGYFERLQTYGYR